VPSSIAIPQIVFYIVALLHIDNIDIILLNSTEETEE